MREESSDWSQSKALLAVYITLSFLPFHVVNNAVQLVQNIYFHFH